MDSHRMIPFGELSRAQLEVLFHIAHSPSPANYIAVQKMIYRVVRLNASAAPNRSIRRLTGTPATHFDRFVNDHRDLWQPI